MHVYAVIAQYAVQPTKFEKHAASAWQRALDAGRLGIRELQQAAGALHPNRHDIRHALQTPGEELAGAALLRHLRKEELRATTKIRASGGELRNAPGMGPAAKITQVPTPFGNVASVRVHVSPQQGTIERLTQAAPTWAKSVGTGYSLAGNDLPPRLYARIAKPVDKGVFSGFAHHELAEKQVFDAATKRGVPLVPFDSHFSVAPTFAEGLGLRHGEGLTILDNMRKGLGSKDAATLYKRRREAGAVANYRPPYGGRAMRSTEHTIARTPADEAASMRMNIGGPRSEAGEARVRQLAEGAPKGTFGVVKAHYDTYAPQMRRAVETNASSAPTFDKRNPDHVRAYLANYTSV